MGLAAGTNVNVPKVVVYHEDDDGNVTLIPLTKKNACKTATQTDCGVAEIVASTAIQVLRVTHPDRRATARSTGRSQRAPSGDAGDRPRASRPMLAADVRSPLRS